MQAFVPLFRSLTLLLAFGTAVAQEPIPAPPPSNTPQEQAQPEPGSENSSGQQQNENPQADRIASSADASIAIVLDNSRDSRRDFDELSGSVETFLRWFTTEDELSLFTAGGDPALVAEFTADKSRLQERLDDLKASGDRALPSAIRAAAEYIRSDAANQNAAIVVFTSARGRVDDLAQIAAMQRDLSTPVHVVTAPGTDWRAQDGLQRLAASSGGSAFFPSSSEQLDEVSEELGRRLGGPLDDPEAVAELGSPVNQKGRYRGLLSSYEQITVHPVPVAEGEQTEEVLGGEEVILQRVLLSRLQRANLFPRVVDGGSSDAAAPPSAASSEPGKQLELLASIIEYRRGNRTQRQVLGGIAGRGAARMGVRVVLLDAATRRPVLAFTETASHASGLFGGSQEHVQSRAILEVANEIVDQISAAK